MDRLKALLGKKIDGKQHIANLYKKSGVKPPVNITLDVSESKQMKKEYSYFIDMLYAEGKTSFQKHMIGLLSTYEKSQNECAKKCVGYNAHHGDLELANIKKMTTIGPFDHAANACVGYTLDDIGKKGSKMRLIDELIVACATVNQQKDVFQNLIYVWLTKINSTDPEWVEQLSGVLPIIRQAESLFRENTSSGNPNYVYSKLLNNLINPPKKMSSLKSTSRPTRKVSSIKPPTKPPKPTRKVSSLKSPARPPAKPPKPTRKVSSIKPTAEPFRKTSSLKSPARPPTKPPKPNQTKKMKSDLPLKSCGRGLPRCSTGYNCNKITSTCDSKNKKQNDKINESPILKKAEKEQIVSIEKQETLKEAPFNYSQEKKQNDKINESPILKKAEKEQIVSIEKQETLKEAPFNYSQEKKQMSIELINQYMKLQDDIALLKKYDKDRIWAISRTQSQNEKLRKDYHEHSTRVKELQNKLAQLELKKKEYDKAHPKTGFFRNLFKKKTN